MTNHDLVSIIIPVYNSSKYLEETIKSIGKQTYNNYEAIFIDDGIKTQSEWFTASSKFPHLMSGESKIQMIDLEEHNFYHSVMSHHLL